MKTMLGIGLIAGALIATLLLMSFREFVPQPMNKNVRNLDVYLVANKNSKDIDIRERGNAKCPANSSHKYGCIDVPVGDEASIKFSLNTNAKSTSYHVTEMRICKGGTKGRQDCNLSAEETKQFAVMEIGGLARYHPNKHGVIGFSDIPKRISAFKLIDLNTVEGEYFYTIKACDGGNTDCRETDPPIRNGGKQVRS